MENSKKKQILAVTWTMMGFIEVEAETMEDARDNFIDNPELYGMPSEGMYVDGTYDLISNSVEDLESMARLYEQGN